MGMWDDAYSDGADENSLGMLRYGVNDVRLQIRDVASFMMWTNEDIAKAREAKKVSHDFYQAWLKTWFAWSKFYDNFDGLPGVVMLHKDQTWETANDYRRKAEQFRKALLELKHPVTPTAKILENKAPRGMSFKPTLSADFKPTIKVGGFPWKWFLIGAGVMGAGYAGYKMFGESPAGKTVAFVTGKGHEGEKKKEEQDDG